jgi:glycosyltransferase involved in cell wall biosynthesis
MARILFVENSAATFVSHRLDLSRAAVAAGFDVHIAVPAAGPGGGAWNTGVASDPDPGAGDPRVTVHRIPLSRRDVSALSEAASVAALTRLYSSVRPDLVHHIRLKPVLHGSVAARLAGVPCVVNSITGLGYLFMGENGRMAPVRKLVELGLRSAMRRRNQRVVFQNSDDRDFFVARGFCPPPATALIRGAGVDVRQFTPSPEPPGPPLVILPSRMLWDKGVGEFVDAARQLLENGLDARFALVGDGDPENRSCIPVSQLERWRESKVVEWWGWRDDLPAIFRQSHVVCLPSYREGLPRVLIEAAAAGRPIVTTDTPGCREIVRHGQNGLLVPVADSVGLAHALRLLIENRDLRNTLGARGRELAVAEFTVERVIAQFFELYRELLSASPRPEARRFAENMDLVIAPAGAECR